VGFLNLQPGMKAGLSHANDNLFEGPLFSADGSIPFPILLYGGIPFVFFWDQISRHVTDGPGCDRAALGVDILFRQPR
jgi:hypothetical protein